MRPQFLQAKAQPLHQPVGASSCKDAERRLRELLADTKVRAGQPYCQSPPHSWIVAASSVNTGVVAFGLFVPCLLYWQCAAARTAAGSIKQCRPNFRMDLPPFAAPQALRGIERARRSRDCGSSSWTSSTACWSGRPTCGCVFLGASLPRVPFSSVHGRGHCRSCDAVYSSFDRCRGPHGIAAEP